MQVEDLIPRINELANKAKKEALTAQELKEQKQLRDQYLKAFRANFKNQLDNTKIKELDGTISPLKPKKTKKNG